MLKDTVQKMMVEAMKSGDKELKTIVGMNRHRQAELDIPGKPDSLKRRCPLYFRLSKS